VSVHAPGSLGIHTFNIIPIVRFDAARGDGETGGQLSPNFRNDLVRPGTRCMIGNEVGGTNPVKLAAI